MNTLPKRYKYPNTNNTYTMFLLNKTIKYLHLTLLINTEITQMRCPPPPLSILLIRRRTQNLFENLKNFRNFSLIE